MRRGEVLGLLGPNGSGKSTPVSMVTSLLEPSTGQVLFDGESIARAPLAYKARVGYVPDEAHLCSYLPDRVVRLKAVAIPPRESGSPTAPPSTITAP